MPTLFHVQEVYRAFPGGAGLNGVTVQARLQADNSLIVEGTTATVGMDDGVIQLSLADTATTGQSSYILHPGPYRLSGTASGVSVTRRQNSLTTGSAGALSLPAMVQLNRAIGNGLIASPANGLNTGAVTAAGVARVVTVDTLAGVIDGCPFWNDAGRTLTISENLDFGTRIDTVVIEMIPAGNAEEGKCTLKVVEGAPDLSPEPPTLTQSSTVWQLPLADVEVVSSASVINPGDLTDRRDFVERSVTAVEADVVQLQADVAALEDVVPREEIVATYVAVLDPPSLPAATWTTVASLAAEDLTFHNGYTEFLAGDIVTVSHSRNYLIHGFLLGYIGASVVISPAAPNVVRIVWVNYTVSPSDLPSGTIRVVVKRLVTS